MFEIRFVLQFARGRAHRAARNVVSSDSWKDIWAGIDATSKLVDQGVREHVSARMLESVNDIIARSEIIESLQRTTLESVQVSLAPAEEISMVLTLDRMATKRASCSPLPVPPTQCSTPPRSWGPKRHAWRVPGAISSTASKIGPRARPGK